MTDRSTISLLINSVGAIIAIIGMATLNPITVAVGFVLFALGWLVYRTPVVTKAAGITGNLLVVGVWLFLPVGSALAQSLLVLGIILIITASLAHIIVSFRYFLRSTAK